MRDALATGDLHLQGWLSNSAEFLRAVTGKTAEPASAGVTLANDGEEKVLGVIWDPKTDTLGFRVGETVVTYSRVGLLSQVASTFDPLGTAAPFTVKAKIRLRLLGIKALDWSDVVDEDDKEWWELWFTTLRQLNAIKVPRCLFPDEDNLIC